MGRGLMGLGRLGRCGDRMATKGAMAAEPLVNSPGSTMHKTAKLPYGRFHYDSYGSHQKLTEKLTVRQVA